MENVKVAQHDIKRDFHNLMYLLKFIKEDGELKNSDNIKMLEKCLEREDLISEKLDVVTEFINKG